MIWGVKPLLLTVTIVLTPKVRRAGIAQSPPCLVATLSSARQKREGRAVVAPT
jgi:hypothetical protein